MVLENEEKNENDDRDHADRPDLPVEISLCAFLDGTGNFRIRSLPGDARRMDGKIRKKAKIRPATAQHMESQTPELSIVRASKVIREFRWKVQDSREIFLRGNG